MNLSWKNIAGYVALAFAVWLVSYVVEWNIRTEGAVDWGDALIGWWGDLVMLHWVKGYQTLIAGVLAFAAGAFVFAAAVFQRQHQLADQSRTLKFERLAMLAYVARNFQRMNVDLTARNFENCRRNLEAIQSAIPKVELFSPGLAAWLNFIIDEIRAAVPATELYDSVFDMRREAALREAPKLAFQARKFFDDFERLIDDNGEYRHVPGKWEEDPSRLHQLMFTMFVQSPKPTH